MQNVMLLFIYLFVLNENLLSITNNMLYNSKSDEEKFKMSRDALSLLTKYALHSKIFEISF